MKYLIKLIRIHYYSTSKIIKSLVPKMIKYKPRGPDIRVRFSITEKAIKGVELFQNTSSQGLEWEISEGQSPFIIDLIEKWMDSYSKKKQPDILLPVVLTGLPPYTTQVLSILKELPFGVTLTYQELAEVTGNPRGARAVGNACARNPFPLIVPCHRVLSTSKGIGGFSCGLEIKQTLLSFEGVL